MIIYLILKIYIYKFLFQKFIASFSSVIGSILYPLSFNIIIIPSNASTVCSFSCTNKTNSSLFLPFKRTLLTILSVVDFQSSVSKFQSHTKNPFSTNIYMILLEYLVYFHMEFLLNLKFHPLFLQMYSYI